MLQSLSTLLLILLLAVGCVNENSTTHTWVEENNLWMEDNVNFVNAVDEDMFNNIIDIAEELYEPIATKWDEVLTVTRLYDNPTVNASAWRNGYGDTEVRMYGGLARREEVIPQGFALVLCHELGHLYGGKPYISTYQKMAAEGQADYYGAGWCLANIVERLGYEGEIEITSYIKKACKSKMNSDICTQQLAGGNSLGKLLSVLKGDKVPNYEKPDKTVVKKTLTSYPKTTQCRLDSYHNGALSKDRPLCWFKPEEKEKEKE